MDLKKNFRKSTLAYFSVLLKKLIKSFDQTLFEQANKANSNQEQNRYYEAMQEFRAKSPLLIEHYQQFLSKGIDDFLAGRSDTVENFGHAPDELSLVDKETLEDELAISIISSKANTRYAESLWKLNRRLAVVRGGQKVDDEQNPCGPNHLCHALQQSARVLEIDNRIKIQFYKMFDQTIMPRAGELYEKLNTHFIEKRVLPNLRFQSEGEGGAQETAEKVQHAMGAVDAQSQGDDMQAGAMSAGAMSGEQQGWVDAQEEQRQQELISAIRSLQGTKGRQGARRTTMAGGANFGAIQMGGAEGASSFSNNDYAFALSALQQQIQLANTGVLSPAKSVEYVEKQFIEQLSKQADGGKHNNIKEEDADIIDLVGMLFKYVLDDPKLPDTIKSLLSHMHTPMLKVALIDKEFFVDSAHPARRLLNLMAEIGGRWMSGGATDKLVYPKLRSIVTRVHQDFVEDLAIFDELMAELGKFATTLEKRAELTEKRNTESEMGLERLAKARLRAEQEIASRMEGKNIPERARDLLEKSWADFLAFNILRHGEKGLSWDSALKVINGVIWSVQASSSSDIVRFRKVQKQLEQSISEGLRTIGYDQEASESLLSDLSKAQELALAQMQEEKTLLEEADESEVSSKQEQLPPVQKSSQQVQSVEPNTESCESEPLKRTGESQEADGEAEADEEKSSPSSGLNGSSSKQPLDITGNQDKDDSVLEKSVEGEEPSADKEPSAEDTQTVNFVIKEEPEPEPEPELETADVADNRFDRKSTAINRQLKRQEQKVAALDDELRSIYDGLEKLEFGTWFEFQEDDKRKAQMLKLAWFSSISDHYMFVNNVGVKSSVKTRMELAQAIKAGSIKAMDGQDKTFMERALESILGRLKLSA